MDSSEFVGGSRPEYKVSHLVVDKQTKREGNTNSEEQYPSPLVNAPNLAKPLTQATGKKRGRQFPAANIELMQPHADRYLALKKVDKNYSTNDSHAAHLTAIAAAGTFGGWVRDRKKKSVSEPSDAVAPSIRFGTGSKRSKPRAHWKLEQLMINYIDMRAHAIEEEGNNLDLTWEYVEFKARELAPKVTAPRRHNHSP